MDAHTGPDRARLKLEALESRVNPDASGFVQSLYGDVLGRTADPSETAQFVQSLSNSTTTQATVARDFWVSAEHRGLLVDGYYQQFLRRSADADGRAQFVQQFLKGVTQQDIEKQFLSSDEYKAAHGTDAEYVEGLYRDVLGRASDAGGMAFWSQKLSSGTSRSDVAAAFLASTEAHTREVKGFYNTILNRGGDTAGQSFWVAARDTGTLSDSVAISFLGSNEFYNLAKNTSSSTVAASLTPGLTEGGSGDHFLDTATKQSDLTSGTTRTDVTNGRSLTLSLNFSHVVNGVSTPLVGARVDVWQADAGGNYSGEGTGDASKDTALRGYETTDADGNVTFHTIIPGWTAGRTPHLYFKVRTYDTKGNVATEFNSQLFFDSPTINAIYSVAPYNARGTRDTTNSTDGLYNTATPRGGATGDQLLLHLNSVGTGYSSLFNVFVP